MNLDFAILNLHIDGNGPNKLEIRSIRNLFEISAARNSRLRFAIQISPFDADPEQIGAIISLIRELYVDRDEYLRIDGKPVLFWFWSSAYDGNRTLLESMREMAADFRNLAFGLRLPKGADESRYTFGFFEGFGLYSPLEVSSEENWDRVWQSAYEASHLAGMTYRMASVSPGYDDRSLLDPRREGNPYRRVPRRNGDTYARSLRFVESLVSPPDIVIVSTYNEYHENTHIESSSGNGEQYIEMTRESVDRIHTITFAFGAGLAAAAGALLGPVFLLYPSMGDLASLKAFSVVILGGLGNFAGAALGGLVLGVAEELGAGYVSSGYRDAVGFLIIVAVLLLRPSGLFARAERVG